MPRTLFPGEWCDADVPLEDCQGERGINASGVRRCGLTIESVPLAFMPRKPLDRLEGDDASGGAGDGVYHPRRLPHGECGVWGRAPRCARRGKGFAVVHRAMGLRRLR